MKQVNVHIMIVVESWRSVEIMIVGYHMLMISSITSQFRRRRESICSNAIATVRAKARHSISQLNKPTKPTTLRYMVVYSEAIAHLVLHLYQRY